MAEILDDSLIREQRHLDRCRSVRYYTLVVSGCAAIYYLLTDITHWPFGREALFGGIAAIALQSLLCFLLAKKKTWRAALQAFIAVGITAYLFYWLF